MNKISLILTKERTYIICYDNNNNSKNKNKNKKKKNNNNTLRCNQEVGGYPIKMKFVCLTSLFYKCLVVIILKSFQLHAWFKQG